METPSGKPFDPDDPNFDPWADDPNAPKEPSFSPPEPEQPTYDLLPDEQAEPPTTIRGPSALLDPQMRGEIEFEILFQQTKTELLRQSDPTPPPPTKSGRPFVWLALSLVVFALSFMNEGLRWTGILILVVGLHELGHFVAMRWFGYRDVRMFFLPFFGGLVVGRNEQALVWQRALVALAGPLPGLVLGLVLYAATFAPLESWVFQFVLMLMALNTLNLLPVMPLDGGRFFEILFLAKRPWSGTIFRALAIAVLIAGAVYFDAIITKLCLGMTALFVLLSTPFAHKAARSRQAIGTMFPNMPEQLAEVPDGQLRGLFQTSLTIAMTHDDLDTSHLVAVMRDLHTQASQRSIGRRRGAMLLGLFALGWIATLIWVGLVVRAEMSRNQQANRLIASYLALGPSEEEWRSAEPTVRNRAIRRMREVYPIPNQDPAASQVRVEFELFVPKIEQKSTP